MENKGFNMEKIVADLVGWNFFEGQHRKAEIKILDDPDLFVAVRNHGFIRRGGQQFLILEPFNRTPPPPHPPHHSKCSIRIYNLPLGFTSNQVKQVLKAHLLEAEITDAG